MSHAKNITRLVAAIALVVGFAFAVPPATAAEDETEPGAEESSAPGPGVCIPFSHPDAPVLSDGCIQLDLNPGEDPTERCEVTATEDPAPVLVECQLSTSEDDQECIQIYWKYEVGPVTWENRGCDGDISVDEDWRPDGSFETTNCLQIYWKVEIGPVVWERSGCSSDVYFNEDWSPEDESPF